MMMTATHSPAARRAYPQSYTQSRSLFSSSARTTPTTSNCTPSTLCDQLIQVQQQLHSSTLDDDGGRETLGQAHEMLDCMGVVHLGAVLKIFCARLDIFQCYLRTPRSFVRCRLFIYIHRLMLGRMDRYGRP
jgi:hypothetical protein